jgi:hypothetical protein
MDKLHLYFNPNSITAQNKMMKSKVEQNPFVATSVTLLAEYPVPPIIAM